MEDVIKNKEMREVSEKILEFMNLSLSKDANSLEMSRLWNTLAVRLFKLQYNHVKPYKNFCDFRFKNNINITDWSEIPCIPTTAFKEFEITSLDLNERIAVFYSSGTTYEKSSRHFHSEFSLKIYEESLSLWFKYCILNKSDEREQLIMLTPPPESVPHSSLVYMFATLKKKYGKENSAFFGIAETENLWKIDYQLLFSALENCERARSRVIILGTAFNFAHLLEYIEHKKVRFALPEGSIVFETGGYKGRSREIPKNELYKKISNYFGVSELNIVSEYGMSELSSQAYDRFISKNEGVKSRVFRFPPWAKYNIVSPETKRPVNTGESGLLRIYDLANIFSLMAIQTDDIAVRVDDGFMLIGRAGQSEPRGCSIMAEF
ncbi:MAG: hypothetical protein ACP5T0_09225 [Verrucomicrobiia bacterium]